MSVTTPTSLSSSNRDKSRRKRQNPMKLDVSVKNSPTSLDLSNPALTPTESSIPVFHSDSADDTPEPTLTVPSFPESAPTPVTPIFTPTLSSQPLSQAIITSAPILFDPDNQAISVTDTTTLLPISTFPTIDNSISLLPDENNPTKDTIPSISPDRMNNSITQHTSAPRFMSVGVTKGSTFQGRKSLFSSRQEEVSQSGPDAQKNDSYCWSCHEGGNVVCCDTCPRVFHLRCAHIDAEPPEDREWLCPMCTRLRSTRRRKGETPPNLGELLRFVMKKLKFEGTEQFQQEVTEEIAPGYRDLVFHPMDLCKIEQNIDKYEATFQLRYEVEWLLHNCIIYNGSKHALTKVARQIVKLCRMELSEIELCANCYKLSCIQTAEWFSQLCDPPHSVVMVEVKDMRNQRTWPGKLVNKGRERCEIRFFGKKHARITVPVSQVFPLSNLEVPHSPPANKPSSIWSDAINELKKYQSNLREWLALHPSHKMVVTEVNDSVAFSPPNEKVNSSEDNMGELSHVPTKVIKKLDLDERMVLQPPTNQFTSNTFFPNSDPTPIALFASASNSNPNVPRISNDVVSGVSKFPIADRLHLKDSSLVKIGADGPVPHFSETASEDDNDDPSFKMSQKNPGRRKRPGNAPDSKQKNKRPILSATPNRVLTSSSKGRGKRTDQSNRKPLHYQFPPDSLNDKLRSSLKAELLPAVQELPVPGVEPVDELMDRSLNLALKHFETKSAEESEEDHGQSKYYKMFLEKFDSLMLDIIADINSGQIDQIQKVLDEIVAREVCNRNKIYHQVYENVREDMQRLIEQCHEVAKIQVEKQSNEIQRQCDRRLDERVRETKKKTWCSYCWDEAYYNCCWNVNYCSEKCQKIHWPEHKPNCIQMLNSPAPPEISVPSEHQPHPTSSREREEDQIMDISSKKSLPDVDLALHKRKSSIDNFRENMKQEDPFPNPHPPVPVERDRHMELNPHHRFTAPSHTLPSSMPHLDKSKLENYQVIPPSLLNQSFINQHHKTPPSTCAPTGDNSTSTTPVYVKAPNISVSSSTGQLPHKEHMDVFPPRGVRYSPMSGSTPHLSPREPPAPPSIPLASSLSQMESNNPNSNVNNRPILPSSGQHKDPHGNHPTSATSHKRVRDSIPNQRSAQSPHSVNSAMFSSPMDGHVPQQPQSFIIHHSGQPVPGAPTTPTSNQPKVLPQAFHSNIGPHNLFQLMNGDVQHNFMMQYPYAPPQGQIIQNPGTLQPNPHNMTPRPHDL